MIEPKTDFKISQVLPQEGHIIARSAGKPQMGIADVPEKAEGTYIYFWHDPRDDKPKTQVWDVLSKESHYWLAQIRWFPRWRKYAWSSTCEVKGQHSRIVSDIVFEETCTYEIANFCKWLTTKHKSCASIDSKNSGCKKQEAKSIG
jgi:hypothetical protein